MESQSSLKRCSKCRVRWFYSKGAFLVILWLFLIIFVAFSQFLLTIIYKLHLHLIHAFINVSAGTLLSFPISGWLADAKYGKYKVFKAGAVLMFLSTVIDCVIVLAKESLGSTVTQIGYSLDLSLVFLGLGACLITAAQLGLDQMPDASSENTTSFIAWYIFSILAATWVSNLLTDAFKTCVNNTLKLNYLQIWSLLLVACMSIVLITDYMLTPKWLIIEPKSPQALKNIYQVLKFAVKHKTPLNRSAFTYWEEDVPSRLDLGKSKYGGPFTTEQVEDVKTIMRIVSVSIPMLLIYTFVGFRYTSDEIPELSACVSTLVYYISYNNYWWVLLCTILQEFVVYPLSLGRLSLTSTFTKIKAGSFALSLMAVICSILTILDYGDIATSLWAVRVIFSVSSGCIYQIVVTSILEFVCAQSPYNMIGLVLGYIFLQFAISTVLQVAFINFLVPWCKTQESCLVYLWSALSTSYILSFVLFCYAARKYKRRVRDDQYFAQAVVEEVYDRRLTAAAAHYSNYYQGMSID